MSSIIQPGIQSHDQSGGPQAISTWSPTKSPHLQYSSRGPFSAPHPSCLSPCAGTILQCAFGPRCGRAAPSVSGPANNAPTEEVQEGSGVAHGFNREEFSLWLHPTPVPDLCPPINISSIWQTHQNATGVSPYSQSGWGEGGKHNSAVFASNKDGGGGDCTGPPDLNIPLHPSIRGSMQCTIILSKTPFRAAQRCR